MTRVLKLADKQEYLTGRRQEVVKTGLFFITGKAQAGKPC